MHRGTPVKSRITANASLAVSGADMCKISGQKGITLLIVVIFISMAAIAYYLTGLSAQEIKHHQIISTSKALHQAKQAVLAYAATRADISLPSPQPGEYGFLPCPETFKNGSEGNSAGSCGDDNVNTIGWLPWKSLGLPPLKDDSGTCLLYAVSASYKSNPSYMMLNEDTNGMFQVVDESGTIIQGTSPEDRVVAIIFAPGKTLPGQSRNNTPGSSCGEDYGNYAAYLDASGATSNSDVSPGQNTVDQFIHATAESVADTNPTPYNDRFITISRDEIWSAILARDDFIDGVGGKINRLTEALAQCIAAYGNDNSNRMLPIAALEGFFGNDYRDSNNYDDDLGSNDRGRYPYKVDLADLIIPGTSGGDILFNKGICDSLPIQLPVGPAANLNTMSGSEESIMWENWKDHIFYAVSDAYDPKSDPYVAAPRCGSCIEVNGVKYAAVVIYSNSRLAGQTRESTIAATDIDTKNDYRNYIELVNPNTVGTGNFTRSGNSNDILFCITDTDTLGVVPCS